MSNNDSVLRELLNQAQKLYSSEEEKNEIEEDFKSLPSVDRKIRYLMRFVNDRLENLKQRQEILKQRQENLKQRQIIFDLSSSTRSHKEIHDYFFKNQTEIGEDNQKIK